MAHLLNLRALADASLDDYSLLSFEGREAISSCFDYRLELITTVDDDLSAWIGKLCEFDISPDRGPPRVFAGRIYGARRVVTGDEVHVLVHVGPAYHALCYASATHFIQDQNSVDIFEAMTGDVTGLVKKVSVSPMPAKRGYAVRYDETELAFLDRLLAQDGIMYFFEYQPGAGAFKHRLILTNTASDYVDVEGGPFEFLPYSAGGGITRLERQYRAAPRKHAHVSHNVNKLDKPFRKESRAAETWGEVYGHPQETIGFEACEEGDLATRLTANDQSFMQQADQVEGTSTEPTFMAGGRLDIVGGAHTAPKKVVLTSVHHSAVDPWMLQGAAPGEYHNRFTAIDARLIYRPPVGNPARVAPGPLLGMVALEGKGMGEAVVDDQWRVPVEIVDARDYTAKKLEKFVWLPVQQQWAHSTHGAQFFPRIGTRVIIDFLYGNPDLPFISGTVYTPSQPYPFDPTKFATQSGWRSITDGNGKIVQELRFEDKPDAEEIYLFTGRDYRRMIENDDWGTVKNNQTLLVEKDRSREVKGKETVDVTDTRTVTVTAKNTLESKKEIELLVGQSSIRITDGAIEITSPKITIKATAQLDMSGGATAKLDAPKTDVTAAATLTLKGGMVMIN